MKIKFLFISLLLICISCSDDDQRNQNPFINPIGFNYSVNLNLPQFNSLNFPGNSEVITNIGIKGVIIYNVNDTLFTAFELSDPNIAPSDCSALKINGIRAESNCGNDNAYDIITGQLIEGEGEYPLFAYRITKNGTTLNISH